MSQQENRNLVQRYYEEMWNHWDFSLVDDLIAEDIAFRGSLGVSVQGGERAESWDALDPKLVAPHA